MLSKIEHIALAVKDLDKAIETYSALWGLTVEHRETVADQQVEEAMLLIGETYIQLLAPTSDQSTVARFIDKRGEGLHHIAYEVDDIDAALEHLAATGARMIDHEPRDGSRGTRIAFVHPASSAGVLVELVQKVL